MTMKRQKRDKLARAYSNGYQAGLCGKTKQHCPYQSLAEKSHWLGGWRKAVSDRNLGLFTGILVSYNK